MALTRVIILHMFNAHEFLVNMMVSTYLSIQMDTINSLCKQTNVCAKRLLHQLYRIPCVSSMGNLVNTVN